LTTVFKPVDHKETQPMQRYLLPLGVLLAVALALPAPARDDKTTKKEDGFKPLFDGKTLNGWVKVNNAPGTFTVKDGMIVTTGKPTGFMRTAKMYENFIAEFEWKHLPPGPKEVGNSGFFVWADALPARGSPFTRAIEVQVLVNLEYRDKKSGKVTATSHGDLFSILGATCVPDRPHPLGWKRCLPSEYRAKGAGEWNHYRIEANDGVLKLAVNGKVVSGLSKCKPRKGYLALEAEGTECRFRNLKIKELPSTNPKKDEVCQEGQGFRTLFNGLNLAGWRASSDGAVGGYWKADPNGNVLRHLPPARESAAHGVISTRKEYSGDFELVVDCLLPKDGKAVLRPRGSAGPKIELSESKGKWARYAVTCKGDRTTVRVDGMPYALEGRRRRFVPDSGTIRLETTGKAEFCNLFIRELK
jgi:hypothetical protein